MVGRAGGGSPAEATAARAARGRVAGYYPNTTTSVFAFRYSDTPVNNFSRFVGQVLLRIQRYLRKLDTSEHLVFRGGQRRVIIIDIVWCCGLNHKA